MLSPGTGINKALEVFESVQGMGRGGSFGGAVHSQSAGLQKIYNQKKGWFKLNYRTVQECAVDIICKEGDTLNNNEIAEKVRQIMGSKTSINCIKWYKSKMKNGAIKVHNDCRWLTGKKNLQKDSNFREDIADNTDDIDVFIGNKSERLVYEYEKTRTGIAPIKMKNSGGNTVGYDFESADRHIEVKGKKGKNTTWLQLTPNETEALIKDPKYYLHLVEGDFSKEDSIDLYIINKADLLSMCQLKIHARLTQLSNQEKRRKWKVETNS